MFSSDQAGCSFFLFHFCPKHLKKTCFLFFISLARFSSRCVLACLIPPVHPFSLQYFILFSNHFNLQLIHSFFCCCCFPRKHLLCIIQSQNPHKFLFCFIAIRCLRKDRQQLCFFFFPIYFLFNIPLGIQISKEPQTSIAQFTVDKDLVYRWDFHSNLSSNVFP